jgi:hypothetical protein
MMQEAGSRSRSHAMDGATLQEVGRCFGRCVAGGGTLMDSAAMVALAPAGGHDISISIY